MMLIWWGLSLLGGMLGAGFAGYMWGSHLSERDRDTEYETGYDEGYQRARDEYAARLDRADQIILQSTQVLGVPRLASAQRGEMPEAGNVSDLPGHTIYPELTPQALDDVPLTDPDCRDGKHGSCVGGPCQCSCHDALLGDAGFQLERDWYARQLYALADWRAEWQATATAVDHGDLSGIEDRMPAWAEVELVKERLVMA